MTFALHTDRHNAWPLQATALLLATGDIGLRRQVPEKHD